MRISRALALFGVPLLAIDGADPVILDRLIRDNKLPTFARLQRERQDKDLDQRGPGL